MKVICPQKDLSLALSHIAPIAMGRTALPILQTIRLNAEESTLSLLSCDGEMWAERKILARIEEPGSICVSAKLLLDLITALPNSNITLEIKDNSLYIGNDHSEWHMLALPANDFPEIPNIEPNSELKLSMSEFKDAIDKVAYAVADDLSRPILTGVLFNYDETQLTLVATDTHRLSVYQLNKEGIGSEIEAVVPEKALRSIKNLPIEDPEEISLKFDDTRLFVQSSDSTIVSQLLAGSFPNWQSVIPQETSGSWTFDKGDFVENVKRTMILARDNANRILFKGSEGQILMGAKSEEKGQAKEEIPAVCKNGEIEIAFNGKYVLEALSTLDAEGVKAEFTESSRPAIIKSADASENENHYCVIMPMALN